MRPRASWPYRTIGKIIYLLFLPIFRVGLSRQARVNVVLQQDGKVLLVKNWLSHQRWQLPGGGVKPGETLEVAASRELREELNLALQPGSAKEVVSGVWQSDRLGYAYHILNAKLSKRSTRLKPNHEIVEAAWLDQNELNWQNLNLETAAALTKVLKLVK